MNMLEDLPAGQLRAQRAEADKTVMGAAVREAEPTVRTRFPQGLERSPLWPRSGYRRVAVVSALSLGLIVALVAILAPGAPRTPPGPVARSGGQAATASGWRLMSDVSPSWRALPDAGDVPGEAKGLNFSCPTTTTCYAANFSSKGPVTPSEVEVTTDGGTTWRALSLPISLLRPPSLSCVNAETCAILGIDESGDSTFLETTDGGQTWSSHAGPSELTDMNGPSELACTAAASCLAVAPGNQKVSPGSAVRLVGAAAFMTGDSGTTWSTASLPTGFIPSALQCTSAVDCVTSGSVSLGGPPMPAQATILHTTDDGANWAAAVLPSQLAAQSTFAPSTLSCADTGNCLAVFSDITDASSEVLSSNDGGGTWAATAASGFPQGGVMSLSCADGADCWAGGVNASPSPGMSAFDLSTTPAVIASTSDGGATWQDAQLPPGAGAIVDISCPSASSCYALTVQQVSGGGNAPQPFVLLAYQSPAVAGS